MPSDNPKFIPHGCACTDCNDAWRDSIRLKALEREVMENGGIVLHTGDFSLSGNSKYAGLQFGSLGRDLREALDVCFRLPWRSNA